MFDKLLFIFVYLIKNISINMETRLGTENSERFREAE